MSHSELAITANNDFNHHSRNGELEETTGMPPYYADEDYPAGPEIDEPLPE